MEIKTERLLLREFEAEDWQVVYTYQNNPLYLRYYDWTERSKQDAQDFVAIFLKQQQATPRHKFQLAITLADSGQLIGNCGVRLTAPSLKIGDIGYELDPLFWGNGYATEAASAMLLFGFEQLQLHRITAVCIAENEGSVRVLTKLGMQQEGRLRENEFFKGRWWDNLLFAILESEWNKG